MQAPLGEGPSPRGSEKPPSPLISRRAPPSPSLAAVNNAAGGCEAVSSTSPVRSQCSTLLQEGSAPCGGLQDEELLRVEAELQELEARLGVKLPESTASPAHASAATDVKCLGVKIPESTASSAHASAATDVAAICKAKFTVQRPPPLTTPPGSASDSDCGRSSSAAASGESHSPPATRALFGANLRGVDENDVLREDGGVAGCMAAEDTMECEVAVDNVPSTNVSSGIADLLAQVEADMKKLEAGMTSLQTDGRADAPCEPDEDRVGLVFASVFGDRASSFEALQPLKTVDEGCTHGNDACVSVTPLLDNSEVASSENPNELVNILTTLPLSPEEGLHDVIGLAGPAPSTSGEGSNLTAIGAAPSMSGEGSNLNAIGAAPSMSGEGSNFNAIGLDEFVDPALSPSWSCKERSKVSARTTAGATDVTASDQVLQELTTSPPRQEAERIREEVEARQTAEEDELVDPALSPSWSCKERSKVSAGTTAAATDVTASDQVLQELTTSPARSEAERIREEVEARQTAEEEQRQTASRAVEAQAKLEALAELDEQIAKEQTQAEDAFIANADDEAQDALSGDGVNEAGRKAVAEIERQRLEECREEKVEDEECRRLRELSSSESLKQRQEEETPQWALQPTAADEGSLIACNAAAEASESESCVITPTQEMALLEEKQKWALHPRAADEGCIMDCNAAAEHNCEASESESCVITPTQGMALLEAELSELESKMPGLATNSYHHSEDTSAFCIIERGIFSPSVHTKDEQEALRVHVDAQLSHAVVDAHDESNITSYDTEGLLEKQGLSSCLDISTKEMAEPEDNVEEMDSHMPGAAAASHPELDDALVDAARDSVITSTPSAYLITSTDAMAQLGHDLDNNNMPGVAVDSCRELADALDDAAPRACMITSTVAMAHLERDVDDNNMPGVAVDSRTELADALAEATPRACLITSEDETALVEHDVDDNNMPGVTVDSLTELADALVGAAPRADLMPCEDEKALVEHDIDCNNEPGMAVDAGRDLSDMLVDAAQEGDVISHNLDTQLEQPCLTTCTDELPDALAEATPRACLITREDEKARVEDDIECNNVPEMAGDAGADLSTMEDKQEALRACLNTSTDEVTQLESDVRETAAAEKAAAEKAAAEKAAAENAAAEKEAAEQAAAKQAAAETAAAEERSAEKAAAEKAAAEKSAAEKVVAQKAAAETAAAEKVAAERAAAEKAAAEKAAAEKAAAEKAAAEKAAAEQAAAEQAAAEKAAAGVSDSEMPGVPIDGHPEPEDVWKGMLEVAREDEIITCDADAQQEQEQEAPRVFLNSSADEMAQLEAEVRELESRMPVVPADHGEGASCDAARHSQQDVIDVLEAVYTPGGGNVRPVRRTPVSETSPKAEHWSVCLARQRKDAGLDLTSEREVEEVVNPPQPGLFSMMKLSDSTSQALDVERVNPGPLRQEQPDSFMNQISDLSPSQGKRGVETMLTPGKKHVDTTEAPARRKGKRQAPPALQGPLFDEPEVSATASTKGVASAEPVSSSCTPAGVAPAAPVSSSCTPAGAESSAGCVDLPAADGRPEDLDAVLMGRGLYGNISLQTQEEQRMERQREQQKQLEKQERKARKRREEADKRQERLERLGLPPRAPPLARFAAPALPAPPPRGSNPSRDRGSQMRTPPVRENAPPQVRESSLPPIPEQQRSHSLPQLKAPERPKRVFQGVEMPDVVASRNAESASCLPPVLDGGRRMVSSASAPVLAHSVPSPSRLSTQFADIEKQKRRLAGKMEVFQAAQQQLNNVGNLSADELRGLLQRLHSDPLASSAADSGADDRVVRKRLRQVDKYCRAMF